LADDYRFDDESRLPRPAYTAHHVRHEQPIRHPLLKVLQDRRLVPWHRNRKRLTMAVTRKENPGLNTAGEE
jgi:hypothetical protein